MPQPLRFPHLYGRVRGRTAQRSCSAAVSGGHDVSAHQPARSMPDEARGLVAPLLSESGVPYSPIRLQNGIGKSTLLSLSLMGWFSGLLPKDLQTRGTMKRKRGPIGPRKQWDRLGSAYGIRTRDLRLRGRRPGPLDECALQEKPGIENHSPCIVPHSSRAVKSGGVQKWRLCMLSVE